MSNSLERLDAVEIKVTINPKQIEQTLLQATGTFFEDKRSN